MPKFLFNIDKEDLEQLRQRADDTGIPVAHQIRQAIKGVLNTNVPCGVVMSGQIVSGFLMVMR